MSTVLTERTEVEMGPPINEHPDEKRAFESAPATRRSSSRGRQWLVIAVLVGAVAIGGGWWLAAADKSDLPAGASGDQPVQQAGKATLGFLSDHGTQKNAKPTSTASIETVPVEVVQQSDILRLTGSLIADERSSVASNASGIAAEVLVDRGSVVRKDDVLVQIDPTDAQNELAEGKAMLEELKARLGIDGDMERFNPKNQPEVRLAKASADLAESNLRRANEMYAKKVISTEAFDQKKTESELATQRYRQSLLLIKQAFRACQTAMVKLAILEKAVADTTIRAPFDGLVAERLVSIGEQISSGMQATEVVTLVRIDPLRLSLTVPQQDVGQIRPGQAVRFHIDSFPHRTFNATVKYIAPVVTKDTRSMIVEAIVPNPDGALRPGMFATAELLLAEEGGDLFIPLGAVQKTGEVARVFVVRNGVAREQVVALGEVEKGKVEIRAGLTGNETLVAHPNLVRDGDAVRP